MSPAVIATAKVFALGLLTVSARGTAAKVYWDAVAAVVSVLAPLRDLPLKLYWVFGVSPNAPQLKVSACGDQALLHKVTAPTIRHRADCR